VGLVVFVVVVRLLVEVVVGSVRLGLVVVWWLVVVFVMVDWPKKHEKMGTLASPESPSYAHQK
jgi:hypothetical protein